MEHFEKIIEALLFKSSTSTHDISEAIQQLNKALIEVHSHCISAQNSVVSTICQKYRETVLKILENTMKSIILRHLSNPESITLSNDIVGHTLRLLSDTINTLKGFTLNTIIDSDGNVYCRVLKPFQLKHGALATPGYITRLSLQEALLLHLLNYIEIIKI